MKKAMLLNCLTLTVRKQYILDSFFSEYLRTLNFTFEFLSKASSSTELHHLTYSARYLFFLTSNIVQEDRKDVWA